jgi:hypothetical protein
MAILKKIILELNDSSWCAFYSRFVKKLTLITITLHHHPHIAFVPLVRPGSEPEPFHHQCTEVDDGIQPSTISPCKTLTLAIT